MPLVVRTSLPADWPARVPDSTSFLRQLIAHRAANPNTTVVMHAGVPSDARCGAELLKAIELLPSDCAVVFSGFSDSVASREVIQKLERLISVGRVILLKDVEFDELLFAMRLCDIGLLLYRNDGIGNFFQCPGRLTEYLNSGLSVVASDYPSLRSVIMEHDLGSVCDSYDAEEIARAITSESKRRKMRGDGVERVRLIGVAKSNLSYERDARRLEKRLQQLLGRPGQ